MAARRGEKVLRPEIAAVMRKALVDVVENGTARRDFEAVTEAGGKTGTGDIRQRRTTQSVARSRTATFVFFIGDRYFGTVTAYVEGAEAARYHFTSALPAQLCSHTLPVTNDGPRASR
jgi:cell division protein FtsI/penicillin-binding protein 2